jgi:hypothetical protein
MKLFPARIIHHRAHGGHGEESRKSEVKIQVPRSAFCIPHLFSVISVVSVVKTELFGLPNVVEFFRLIAAVAEGREIRRFVRLFMGDVRGFTMHGDGALQEPGRQRHQHAGADQVKRDAVGDSFRVNSQERVNDQLDGRDHACAQEDDENRAHAIRRSATFGDEFDARLIQLVFAIGIDAEVLWGFIRKRGGAVGAGDDKAFSAVRAVQLLRRLGNGDLDFPGTAWTMVNRRLPWWGGGFRLIHTLTVAQKSGVGYKMEPENDPP